MAGIIITTTNQPNNNVHFTLFLSQLQALKKKKKREKAELMAAMRACWWRRQRRGGHARGVVSVLVRWWRRRFLTTAFATWAPRYRSLATLPLQRPLPCLLLLQLLPLLLRDAPLSLPCLCALQLLHLFLVHPASLLYFGCFFSDAAQVLLPQLLPLLGDAGDCVSFATCAGDGRAKSRQRAHSGDTADVGLVLALESRVARRLLRRRERRRGRRGGWVRHRKALAMRITRRNEGRRRRRRRGIQRWKEVKDKKRVRVQCSKENTLCRGLVKQTFKPSQWG